MFAQKLYKVAQWNMKIALILGTRRRKILTALKKPKPIFTQEV
jgi:hypothetical protein